MIDNSLIVPPDAAFWFYAKQAFWTYMFPAWMGFFSVLCIQVYTRIGIAGNVKMHSAFIWAAISAMANLWGWAHLVRTPSMIPFYGCGVGVAAAMMSRIFAIIKDPRTRWKVPVPRVIWKGNTAEIQALMERMRAAQQSMAVQ